MKKRMEQIEEILSCEENSAGVRLKELVDLPIRSHKSKLVKGNKYLTYESKIQKNLCIRRQSCYYAVSTFTK